MGSVDLYIFLRLTVYQKHLMTFFSICFSQVLLMFFQETLGNPVNTLFVFMSYCEMMRLLNSFFCYTSY